MPKRVIKCPTCDEELELAYPGQTSALRLAQHMLIAHGNISFEKSQPPELIHHEFMRMTDARAEVKKRLLTTPSISFYDIDAIAYSHHVKTSALLSLLEKSFPCTMDYRNAKMICKG